MELVEIRDLDGPNLFALAPTLKLEVVIEPGEALDDERRETVARTTGACDATDPLAALQASIQQLHRDTGLPAPTTTVHPMDQPNHYAVCFPWEWRQTSIAIAQRAFDLVSGTESDPATQDLEALLAEDKAGDDRPTWVRDDERRIPTAAVTGTNGKTTTTRLIAHILRNSGYSVGWSSSSGVYINGEQVIPGDYTGHGGARRVLSDPGIDFGVLETARGGILLRGLGYESNDVGVFLNVSPDHLHLHGVTTLETLARVKGSVVRTTRPGGIAVLSADDPLVLAQRDGVRAEVVLTSQNPEHPAIVEHMRAQGRCVVARDGEIYLYSGDSSDKIIDVAEVPLTYGGAARHMVENTLAATAAAIGLGIDLPAIAAGLRSFHPDADHNAGRLNVFELDEQVFVVDFAHNESGLQYLIDFARSVFPESSRLTAIVGTAGDREDSVFIGLGRIAGELADRIIIKENPGYLRGRNAGEMIALVHRGVQQAGAEERIGGGHASEYEAAVAALDSSQPGETMVIMCVEDYPRIVEELQRRGAKERTAAGT